MGSLLLSSHKLYMLFIFVQKWIVYDLPNPPPKRTWFVALQVNYMLIYRYNSMLTIIQISIYMSHLFTLILNTWCTDTILITCNWLWSTDFVVVSIGIYNYKYFILGCIYLVFNININIQNLNVREKLNLSWCVL